MDIAERTASGSRRHSGCEEKLTDYIVPITGPWLLPTRGLWDWAFLVGEFFSKPLGAHERHIGGNKDGLIIMTPSGRTLAFGSRMSGWDDFE